VSVFIPLDVSRQYLSCSRRIPVDSVYSVFSTHSDNILVQTFTPDGQLRGFQE